MFTGIIEELGSITRLERTAGSVHMRVSAPGMAHELKRGDSVAVSGVCLTVVEREGDEFAVEAVEETLKKTTIGERAVGDKVNLELPVKADGRFGGHIVLGHADTVGQIVRIQPREESSLISVSFPPEFRKYVIPVGSVAVDGISLTIAELGDAEFGVSIIPHTMEKTTMKHVREGTHVNIEFDVLGKYVVHLVSGRDLPTEETRSFLTEKHLRELGY